MDCLYYYTARNAEGSVVQGAVEAKTDADALASLRTRALFVTSLSAEKSVRGIVSRLRAGPPKQQALVAFFRSFATLMSAGVAMRRALAVTIEECADRRLCEALRALVVDIEGGTSLSEAMKHRPKEFRKLFVAMIRAGEAGGVLEEVLQRLASFLEYDRATRKRLTSALAYPAIVAASALTLTIFLMSTIVPMFASLFAQMHVDLPMTTAVLLAVSRLAHNPRNYLLASSLCLLIAFCLGRYFRTQNGAILWDTYKLRIPVLGQLMRKAAVARLARILGYLLKSGVSLVFAVEIVADAIGNAAYSQSMLGVRRALREGDALTEPFASSGLYEPLVLQLVRVGEETGSLDRMLLRIAEYYESDVEAGLAALGSTLEPVLIICLGGLVGFIVFSIFIPLYTLIGNIK